MSDVVPPAMDRVAVPTSAEYVSAAPTSAEYVLTFAPGSLLRPSVIGTVERLGDRLVVGLGGGVDHVPGGWTSFVEELQITDPDGNAVPVELIGEEGWQVVGDYRGPAQLRYRVNLDFATTQWPPGNEQAGLLRGDELFVVTKPLFVAPQDLTGARVRIEVPAGSRVAVPWRETEPGAYQVDGLASLRDNSLVVSPRATSRKVESIQKRAIRSRVK